MLKIIVVAAVLLPVNALAQQGDAIMSSFSGTLGVRAEPMLQGGKLQGCSLVFNALTPDWKYRNGAFLKIEGSVLISITENGMGSMLKVVANEAVMLANGTLRLNPSPPTRAYIISKDYKTNVGSLHTSGPSDTPGGLLSVYQLFPTAEMAMEAASDEKLTIAFNQNNGNSDIILPIDLRVLDVDSGGKRTLGSKSGEEFLACLDTLVQNGKPTKSGRVTTTR